MPAKPGAIETNDALRVLRAEGSGLDDDTAKLSFRDGEIARKRADQDRATACADAFQHFVCNARPARDTRRIASAAHLGHKDRKCLERRAGARQMVEQGARV
jgi:hypothetical protein